jgi:uncharacterized membrane protein/LysM repeat protein
LVLNRKNLDLLIVVAVTAVTATLVIAFPAWQSTVRVALGLVVVLLAPGYVLAQALFPRHDDVDGVERLALTLGLSIAAVPLLGLILNYLPWGIRLAPMAIALSLWVVVFAGLAAWRRARGPAGTAFAMPWGTPQFRQGGALFALVMVVLLGVPALAVALRPSEHHTEFYVLGSTGQLQSYPTRLAPGERYTLTFGVGNFEGEPLRYILDVPFGEERRQVVTPMIQAGERWEQAFELVTPAGQGRTRLPFELYRFDVEEPYRSLHLFVTLPGQTLFPELEGLELRPLVPIARETGPGEAIEAGDVAASPQPAADDAASEIDAGPAAEPVTPTEPIEAEPATPADTAPPPPADAASPAPAPAPPAPTPPAPPAFTPHTVQAGDTLFGLARTYLADGNRYPEIVEVNRDLVSGETGLRVGTVLRIPVAP